MLRMTIHFDPYPISDVCLLLRAHAEQGWLSHELVPLLRQFEQSDSLPQDELDAALAYLEVLWLEACQRAAETEAAYAELDTYASSGDRVLSREARSYRTAVCALRDAVGHHVDRLLGVPSSAFMRDPTSPPCNRVRFREWRRAATSSHTPPTQTAP
jgi:hypothetical protein